MKLKALLRIFVLMLVGLWSCDQKNNIEAEDSPTAGKLKVFYDAGLKKHVTNQALTFESQYPNSEIILFESSENRAVQALYNDSCELIVISRDLTEEERNAFASKQFDPKFSRIAKSGVAVLTNIATPLNAVTVDGIKKLLTGKEAVRDSSDHALDLKIIFDQNNSSVLHYICDSILHGEALGPACNILNSTPDAINYVSSHKNTLALIDFAWISDVDDSLYKANTNKIKLLALSQRDGEFALPGQSSFKLQTYPFTRTVYAIRKTGDFTLAKGFESFMAGPKGQLTFLKQGLLPTRQNERSIHVNKASDKEKN
jgi:phosphate transport system substrate-binding protein